MISIINVHFEFFTEGFLGEKTMRYNRATAKERKVIIHRDTIVRKCTSSLIVLSRKLLNRAIARLYWVYFFESHYTLYRKLLYPATARLYRVESLSLRGDRGSLYFQSEVENLCFPKIVSNYSQ